MKHNFLSLTSVAKDLAPGPWLRPRHRLSRGVPCNIVGDERSAGTPDAVSSADLAFDQPLKGVPRSRHCSRCPPDGPIVRMADQEPVRYAFYGVPLYGSLGDSNAILI